MHNHQPLHGITVTDPPPPTPYDIVSQSLKSFGALSIQDFISGPTYHVLKLAQEDPSERKPIEQLYQTCQHVFGQTSCLRFEFIMEDKQCILTITRPDGATRSYKSQDLFESRPAAREHIGALAVSLGALEFIMFGDSDVHNTDKGTAPTPLDSHAPMVTDEPSELESPESYQPSPIQQIEDCCRSWRAGRIRPQWFSYSDTIKNGGGLKHGAALRIQLSPHVFRIYSTPLIYINVGDAKEGCATIAVDQAVLEYIKHGNGQTQPMLPGPPLDNAGNVRAMSLQGFYDTLPQPFPEPVGDKTASQISALSWMNNAIQAAHGSRLDVLFASLFNHSTNLHGYLLRIERLGSCKTYVVDPVIEKRSDAKAAVCLLAMSQSIGTYLRGLQKDLDEKLSTQLKKFAHDKLLHLLGVECRRVQPGSRPEFEFNKDRDAFGCTLKVDLSPVPSNPDIREYTVPPDYRTKADAKAAVACEAAQKGVIELFRFGSEPPPPGYVTVWEARYDTGPIKQVSTEKRKEPPLPVTDEQPPRKKRQRGNKKKSAAAARASLPDESSGGGIDLRQGPRTSGPSASVSAGAPSHMDGRLRTQNRTGARHTGGPAASAPHTQSRSAPSSYAFNATHPHPHPLPAPPHWNASRSTIPADDPYYPTMSNHFTKPLDPPYYPRLSNSLDRPPHLPYYPDPPAGYPSYNRPVQPPLVSGSNQSNMYRTTPATYANNPTRPTDLRHRGSYPKYQSTPHWPAPKHRPEDIELYYGEQEEGELNGER